MVLRQGSNPKQPAHHRGAVGLLPPLHMWLFPPMLLALYSVLTMYCNPYCLVWGVYTAWCVGEGLGVPGLAFLNTNRWKPDSKMFGSPLWRWMVLRQGSNPIWPAPRVGSVWLSHPTTHGYTPYVVSLIFSPHDVLYAFYLVLAVCTAWCVVEELGAPYRNVSPAWPSWTPTIKSLTVKCWKFTMEKNGASSRIKPGTACTPGIELWSSATWAPVIIPTICLALYSFLMMYCISWAVGLVWVYYMMCWGRVKGWVVLWGSATPAPEVILPMLLALYSILTMYCIALYEYIVWCVGEGLRAPIL